uniref:Uncharacterized protein n=1 Tax=Chrysemys picta bellii TaxID=8478 RepID=A0A8C3I4T2_CHRPI
MLILFHGEQHYSHYISHVISVQELFNPWQEFTGPSWDPAVVDIRYDAGANFQFSSPSCRITHIHADPNFEKLPHRGITANQHLQFEFIGVCTVQKAEKAVTERLRPVPLAKQPKPNTHTRHFCKFKPSPVTMKVPQMMQTQNTGTTSPDHLISVLAPKPISKRKPFPSEEKNIILPEIHTSLFNLIYFNR